MAQTTSNIYGRATGEITRGVALPQPASDRMHALVNYTAQELLTAAEELDPEGTAHQIQLLLGLNATLFAGVIDCLATTVSRKKEKDITSVRADFFKSSLIMLLDCSAYMGMIGMETLTKIKEVILPGSSPSVH